MHAPDPPTREIHCCSLGYCLHCINDFCKKTVLLRYIFRYKFVFVLIFFSGTAAFAQTFPEKNYPQNYFQWPVGAAIGLAANFGELRPNHWHMGLDCRTDQTENRSIYAAAEGYIAKVKIEPYGFGRCIYINHPNGLTTLYAHLNAFEPDLEKYITQQQYNLEKWKIFIDIPAGLFSVKKGDYIAASGNTGGSQGPHLHFEIRDTKSDKCLNPLLFGFPLQDNISPDILRLAVYDRTISTYSQTPKIYPLRKINGVYQPAIGRIIAPSDKVSFAITAYDRYTGSTNQNGIYAAAVFDNGTRISSFELDSISYDETRFMNAHVDHPLRARGGSWVQHISPLPGYNNGIYKTDDSKGIVSLNDAEHSIKIIVADANGNNSFLNFTMAPSVNNIARTETTGPQKFIPRYVNIYDDNFVKFWLPEIALYDTVNFAVKEIPSADGKNIYQLHNATIPVHPYFKVNIRDNPSIADTGKVVIKRFYGSKTDFKKAAYKNGFYSASFREFGNFQLVIDNTPPSVVPVGFRDGMNTAGLRRILFAVKDNTEEIDNFTALLDGKWLRFSNDKARNFIYVFDEYCPPGRHELLITVTDQVGNKTERKYNFTR